MYNLGDFYCKFQAAYGAGREKGREEGVAKAVGIVERYEKALGKGVPIKMFDELL